MTWIGVGHSSWASGIYISTVKGRPIPLHPAQTWGALIHCLRFRLQAAPVGGWCGGALLAGCCNGYLCRLPKAVSASVMASGIGVLISPCPSICMKKREHRRCPCLPLPVSRWGLHSNCVAKRVLAKRGRRGERKVASRAVGASTWPSAGGVPCLATGIPESAAIGQYSAAGRRRVALVTVLPLSCRKSRGPVECDRHEEAANRRLCHFTIWQQPFAVAVGVSASRLLVIRRVARDIHRCCNCLRGGGRIFVMLIDTMIPEPFDEIARAIRPHRCTRVSVCLWRWASSDALII